MTRCHQLSGSGQAVRQVASLQCQQADYRAGIDVVPVGHHVSSRPRSSHDSSHDSTDRTGCLQHVQ